MSFNDAYLLSCPVCLTSVNFQNILAMSCEWDKAYLEDVTLIVFGDFEQLIKDFDQPRLFVS